LEHLARIFTLENKICAQQLDWWMILSVLMPILWPHTYPNGADDVKRQGGWTEGLLLSDEAVDYVKSLPLHELLLKIVCSKFKYDEVANPNHN
jgi:hypothetical protein